MSAEVKILIADDHPMFREGLRQAIEKEPSFRVIQEAGDGIAALGFIRSLKPDLCILDICMPKLDGFCVVRQMQEEQLPGQVIFLTMYKEEDLFNEAMDLGVNAYVLKESAVTEVLDSIRTVAAGHSYISPGLSDFVLARRDSLQAFQHEQQGLEALSPAERRILKLITEDKTSKEIAHDLGLSVRTVENHRAHICTKLDLHGTHTLLRFAFANKSRL